MSNPAIRRLAAVVDSILSGEDLKQEARNPLPLLIGLSTSGAGEPDRSGIGGQASDHEPKRQKSSGASIKAPEGVCP